MAWTESQEIANAIVPRITAFLSLLGSSAILAECFYYDRRKLKRVYHRIICVMSIYDILESIFNMASTWPIPAGTSGVKWAVGNTQTCELQGFFLQFGLAIPVLNTCLSIYYLLVIKYSWSEEKIQKYAEPWFQGIAFVLGFGTSAACVALDQFNSSAFWCWIVPYPVGCLDSISNPDAPPEEICTRGDNAWLYQWLFWHIPLFTCTLIIFVTMGDLYWTVYKLEQASSKYTKEYERAAIKSNKSSQTEGSQNNDEDSGKKKKASRSKKVATQAFFYVVSFLITFMWSIAYRLLESAKVNISYSYLMIVIFFDPAQGLINYLVYVRPRFVSYRERNPSASVFQTFKVIMTHEDEKRRYGKGTKSKYIDDDHENEEGAKNEIAAWMKRKVSGMKKSMENKTTAKSTRNLSSTGMDGTYTNNGEAENQVSGDVVDEHANNNNENVDGTQHNTVEEETKTEDN